MPLQCPNKIRDACGGVLINGKDKRYCDGVTQFWSFWPWEALGLAEGVGHGKQHGAQLIAIQVTGLDSACYKLFHGFHSLYDRVQSS